MGYSDRIVGLERVRAGDLQPHEANWRQHPDSQVAALRGLLSEVGWASALLAYRSNGHLRLIDGHLRAGLDPDEQVPVLILDVDDAEAEKLLLSIDPLAAMAQANGEALRGLLERVETSDAGLESMLAELSAQAAPKQGRTDPDDVPQDVETRTKPGDLWLLGEHRLLCGDALAPGALELAVDGGGVALVMTSPPYGVGIDYGSGYEDSLESLRDLLARLPKRLADVVQPGGYACINFGDIISASGALGTEEVCEYPMAVEYWPVFRAAGWFLHSRRIWAKPHARVAAPWCASSNRAASDWEHIWTWKMPGDGLNERRGPYSYLGVWDTSDEHGVDVGKDVFGSGMAVAVAQHCIEVYSDPDDLILEPFCGTGTTLIAADMLGRVCSAVELDPRAADITVARWEAFTGQTAELA